MAPLGTTRKPVSKTHRLSESESPFSDRLVQPWKSFATPDMATPSFSQQKLQHFSSHLPHLFQTPHLRPSQYLSPQEMQRTFLNMKQYQRCLVFGEEIVNKWMEAQGNRPDDSRRRLFFSLEVRPCSHDKENI